MSEEDAKQLVRDAIRLILVLSLFQESVVDNILLAGLESSMTWDQAATSTWW